MRPKRKIFYWVCGPKRVVHSFFGERIEKSREICYHCRTKEQAFQKALKVLRDLEENESRGDSVLVFQMKSAPQKYGGPLPRKSHPRMGTRLKTWTFYHLDS